MEYVIASIAAFVIINIIYVAGSLIVDDRVINKRGRKNR